MQYQSNQYNAVESLWNLKFSTDHHLIMRCRGENAKLDLGCGEASSKNAKLAHARDGKFPASGAHASKYFFQPCRAQATCSL